MSWGFAYFSESRATYVHNYFSLLLLQTPFALNATTFRGLWTLAAISFHEVQNDLNDGQYALFFCATIATLNLPCVRCCCIVDCTFILSVGTCWTYRNCGCSGGCVLPRTTAAKVVAVSVYFEKVLPHGFLTVFYSFFAAFLPSHGCSLSRQKDEVSLRIPVYSCYSYGLIFRLSSRGTLYVVDRFLTKVKLLLCSNWAPRHEGVLREWRYSSTHFLPRHYMEVSGQFYAPAALPPGEETLVPTGKEGGWAPEPGRTWWWGENLPATRVFDEIFSGCQPRQVSVSDHHQSVVVIMMMMMMIEMVLETLVQYRHLTQLIALEDFI
jgi:hypothetical protein